jgi:copper chaperone CopZ
MKRLRHLPLWLSTALVLAFATFPRWSSLVLAATPAATAPSQAATEKQVVLGIEGMTCGGCATKAESALARVPGVKKVSVSYEKGQALIVADPSVAEESLVKAVEGVGYRVVGKGTPAAAKEQAQDSSSLPVLKGSLKPLVNQFNRDVDKPRVIALLSPT